MKPGLLQVVDRVLKVYVPGVLAFSALGFLLWTVGAWAVTGQPDPSRAIFAALAVLVMGYPCALGMATPLAMIRGSGEAAQKGILMRSGEAFQVFKDVQKVMLDKTGTITKGQPSVTDVVTMTHGPLPALSSSTSLTVNSSKGTHDRILHLAASVEQASEHPLARAVVDKAARRGIALAEAQDFRAEPGHGVAATVEGRRVLLGNRRLMAREGVDVAPLLAEAGLLEGQGKTVMFVAVTKSGDPVAAGLIAIADTLKDDAPESIARLKADGLEPILVTGDNARTAQAVAAAVGIEQVLAEVLPDEKAIQVRELQTQGYRVAMVGDGINDAPALMQADVGIAIGAGSDIAIESSDVILVGDRLGGVVEAYHIGRRSYRKTVQNLGLAFAFNGIGVPAAVTGLVHPVWAMIAMALSVSAVLLNSFGGRLLPRAERTEKSASDLQRVALHVPAIHCEGCLRTITTALTQLPEVDAVESDLEEKVVVVHYRDGIMGTSDIREAVMRAGFPVA